MKWLITFIVNILLALLLFYNSSTLDGLNDEIGRILIIAIIDGIFIYPIALVIGAIIYSLFYENQLKEDYDEHSMSFGYTAGLIVFFIINLFTTIAPRDPILFLVFTSLPALFIGSFILEIFII